MKTPQKHPRINNQHVPIHQWPDDDRPREKCLSKGPGSLSDAELIALLLGSGSRQESAIDLARRLLTRFENVYKLANSGLNELCRIPGIGPAKATTIHAAGELSRRIQSFVPDKKATIRSPEDVFRFYGPRYADMKQEVFSLLTLDTANQVIRHIEISKGTINQSLCHPREVFHHAIQDLANSIVIFHNHPSGNPSASQEDIRLTKKMVDAGNLIGIKVIDHIILAGKQFTSLAGLGYC